MDARQPETEDIVPAVSLDERVSTPNPLEESVKGNREPVDSGISDMEEVSVLPTKKTPQDAATKKKERNLKKKQQKKRSRQEKRQTGSTNSTKMDQVIQAETKAESVETDGVEVVFVPEPEPEELKDVTFRQFRKVFEHFRVSEEDEEGATTGGSGGAGTGRSSVNDDILSNLPSKARAAMLAQMKDEEEERVKKSNKDNDDDPTKVSKKKMKRMTRLSVAGLKQLVVRPDVVEMHDVCAHDPKLLVHLKAYRNTVPVPRHWSAKRKYLQGKRGIEKPPFRLPDFIVQTGIIDMRQVAQDAEADKTLKGKMRDKVRPKVGKVDIDYNKLHDAFFKYQTKPKLTLHGDLYYEGKEYEVRMREKKPGNLSDELKTALGMPVGAGSERFPPPWLIAMQRYGPPPSYPNLKVSGLNAPIPEGCSFGYHAGGWGKPPVDELGRPLYGDVFGYGTGPIPNAPVRVTEKEIDGVDNEGELLLTTKFWGELESDEEESDEEDESDDEGDKDDVDMDVEGTGLVTPATGLVTPSGVSSILGGGATSSLGGGVISSRVGMDTPQSIELRKRQQQAPGADQYPEIINDGFRSTFSSILGGPGDQTPQLYKILPEMQTNIKPTELMGSTKTYALGSKPGTESIGASDSTSMGALSSSSKKRKRGGDSSTTSGASSGVDKHGESGASSKKYKEFKF